MARSIEDVESHLRHLGRPFERVDERTFLIATAPGQPALALRIDDPLVVMQLDIGPAPSGDPALEARVFRRLLALNAADLVHVAYALEDDTIVLGAALDLESLRLGELEGVLAGVDLALAEHVPELRDMVKKGA